MRDVSRVCFLITRLIITATCVQNVKNTISKAATNHPLLRTLAQTKQLAEHYTYLKPLTEFDEYEFKFAVNRVLVDSESCTFELKNGMKFKEIF